MSLCIAIVGAECTGKSTLAIELAQQLRQRHRLRVASVPEALRGWCDRVGRTPLAHEQAAIARAQQAAIDDAAANHDVVVCDTTALMTAVYSQLIFADHSLDDRAIALQQRMAITLLTANDLPWQADGLQRDGPQVREPVRQLLWQMLHDHQLPFAEVAGAGAARVQRALGVVEPLLQAPAAPRALFGSRPGGRWTCSCCMPAASLHASLNSGR
jgi:nicotinamide riboside kinase